ncbi:hypothetical protein [Endozoicomonas sp. SCSIO W0465]|uniref:hypothetical protein n=1 Tax=Endozoicomonas sp. SCSIO W0465 TaxID=2918516 RepID=UPI00207600FA|nr:hypothetical protein [Endozoicomonas sp. SCSIO W0465]USE38778.1 hypothetical protein MJO57_11755 [Endozoicomonas sp. SCSIO W0465]
MNVNVPLDEVMGFSFTYDPIQIARLANSISEGFCRADTLLSAISSKQGTFLKSLDNMVSSVFNGVGYAKYPYQLRFLLQENYYAEVVDGLDNSLLSVGTKSESIQSKYARITFDNFYLAENRVPFKSAEELLDKVITEGYKELFRLKLKPESPIQVFITPTKKHIVYMEIQKVDTGFRLTFQDIQTGLKIVNGNSLSSLSAEATRVLREVFEYYKIPLTDAGPQPIPPSAGQGTSFSMAFNLQGHLDNIGKLQILPDSALTIKEVVTHDISELKALDDKAIKSMIEEYASLMTDRDNQKRLKLDNLGDKLPDMPASTKQIDG